MTNSFKIRIYILLLITYGLSLTAQPGVVDSMKVLLKKKNVADSIRINTIIAYSLSWPNPPFDEVVPLLDEGYQLAIKTNQLHKAQQILARKITYYTQNNKGIEAFSICQEMIRLGEKDTNYTVLGRAYYFRGNIFQSYGMMEKAIEEQKKAVEYYSKSDDKIALSDAQYLLGWYSFNHRDPKTALANFLAAYRYSVTCKKASDHVLGEYSGWVGNSYGALKKYDSAIYYRHLSLNYFKACNDGYGYPDAYRYLGNIYRNQKMYDSAMVNYRKSYELFVKNDIKERKWLLQYFIAETHAALKDYRSSAKELDNLLDSVKGTRDLLSMLLGNQLGAKVYEKNNEFKKSIKCYKNYIVYKDSSEKSGQQGALTELDAKLKFEEEENALKLKQAQKDADALRLAEEQAIIRNFLLAGVCVMGLFLVVVYRNYKQKQKANKLLELQKNEIEYQKKEIEDSINYAQNIQSAVLPDYHDIEKLFNDMFIFYKPKDVVSGDFFWYNKAGESILIAAADCTGHGVPGAFMSMIGNFELNNSVQERGLVQPSKILSHINFSLKKRLKQNHADNVNKDGMDIVLCSFNLKNLTLQYAGANRPLYIMRNETALEYPPTKAAIGGHTADEREFDNNVIQLQKGDCVYLYTDGYSDQFGGDKNKKLTTKNFKQLLKTVSSLTMKEQYAALEKYFYEWKGNFEQLDDILVIGIRV